VLIERVASSNPTEAERSGPFRDKKVIVKMKSGKHYNFIANIDLLLVCVIVIGLMMCPHSNPKPIFHEIAQEKTFLLGVTLFGGAYWGCRPKSNMKDSLSINVYIGLHKYQLTGSPSFLMFCPLGNGDSVSDGGPRAATASEVSGDGGPSRLLSRRTAE
jgi:hypothetical protein